VSVSSVLVRLVKRCLMQLGFTLAEKIKQAIKSYKEIVQIEEKYF